MSHVIEGAMPADALRNSLALARHVGAGLPGGDADPVAAFVTEMNRLAAERGAVATRFENPVGLDGPNHRTSARDLALLTAIASTTRPPRSPQPPIAAAVG